MNTQEKFSTERWDELSRQWERDEITIEQLNGQLLVWIGELYRMMEAHHRAQDGLSHSCADLDARLQELAAKVS